MRRKTLSIFMVFCMLFALFPATASATDPPTGTVHLERTGNGSIETIGDDPNDIVWNGNSGTQTLDLETIGGQPNLMNAHYSIIADPGYRITSVRLLYTIDEDTVPGVHEFDLGATSGEGGFFGRVLDGGNSLIAGSIRWLAEDGDQLVVAFGNASASRETVTADGEAGLLLAQTLPGADKVEVRDTFTISNNMTIARETEIKNGTVTVATDAALNIDGCSFGPDFTKAVINPSKLVNYGAINVNDGGTLYFIDENYGDIFVNNGGIMEAGVKNTSVASITVRSGGEARTAMSDAGRIRNAGQYTVEAGAILRPWKGAGFKNYIVVDEGPPPEVEVGTLTLDGDVIFDEGYWSDFLTGTLQGNGGRFIINYRIHTDDLDNLTAAVDAARTNNGASLEIIDESVVELDDSAGFSEFAEAVTNPVVRAIYLTGASITINQDLSITNKNIHLEGGTAMTLEAGKTLTLTDTGGTGFLCGLKNAIDNDENITRPATSFTVDGRLVLENGAGFGGYIGTVTIGSGGVIDNSDGSVDVRYTVYCDGTITNMDYLDRADTGHLRIFSNGVLIRDGVGILGEQSGSITAAQNDPLALSMSVSRATELLMDTVYEQNHTPAAITLTKDLAVPEGALLWVPDLETYDDYVNIGDTVISGTGTAALTVGSGKTLTIAAAGSLRLNGPLTNNGTLLYNGSVTGGGPIGGTGLFVLAPNTTVKITTGGGLIRGVNDDPAGTPTESGRGYTVGSDGRLITSHSIYAADNSLDLIVGAAIEGLLQNGAALAPPVGLAQAAVATAGLNTSDNYAAKLEAELESITQNNGMTLVYDIKPKISVNGGAWAEIAALEGSSANNTSVSFRLPVPSDTAEGYVRIVHKNGEIVRSIDFYPVLTDVAGNKYAEITTTSFSTFEMGFADSHTVTLSGGGSGAAGGGSYMPGVTVTINAGTRDGYSFSGWRASSGITFENAASAGTTFTMPDRNVTVTANWRYDGGDGDGGGGGGGTPAFTSETPVTKGNVTTITTEIKASLAGASAAAAVTGANMDRAIDAALEAAARSSTSANINLVVDAPEKATEVKATIPAASLSKLTGADSSASLTVTTPVGSITFDSDALSSIGAAASGTDVTISVAEVPREGLTPGQQALVGDRPVIDLSVTSDGSLISDFGGGSAGVSIPYTLAEGESAEDIVVWYLADDGTLTPVECSWRDGRLTFKTDHFSQYVLAYFPFNDLNGGEWYYENAAYAYTNGLMNGVGNNRFDPSGTTMKGMAVTILWRLEGSPASAAHSFTDVASGMWYADAVSWAAGNGIVEGYGGKFSPEAAVTREQLAAIICRYAAYKGYDVSGPDGLSSFTDAGDISDWAEPAMKWAVKNNLLSGLGNNKLDPAGSAQRAQLAAILQRFIESTVK